MTLPVIDRGPDTLARDMCLNKYLLTEQKNKLSCFPLSLFISLKWDNMYSLSNELFSPIYLYLYFWGLVPACVWNFLLFWLPSWFIGWLDSNFLEDRCNGNFLLSPSPAQSSPHFTLGYSSHGHTINSTDWLVHKNSQDTLKISCLFWFPNPSLTWSLTSVWDGWDKLWQSIYFLF